MAHSGAPRPAAGPRRERVALRAGHILRLLHDQRCQRLSLPPRYPNLVQWAQWGGPPSPTLAGRIDIDAPVDDRPLSASDETATLSGRGVPLPQPVSSVSVVSRPSSAAGASAAVMSRPGSAAAGGPAVSCRPGAADYTAPAAAAKPSPVYSPRQPTAGEGVIVPADAATATGQEAAVRFIRRGGGFDAEPQYTHDYAILSDAYGFKHPAKFRPPRLLHRQWGEASTITGRSALPPSRWGQESIPTLVTDEAGGLSVRYIPADANAALPCGRPRSSPLKRPQTAGPSRGRASLASEGPGPPPRPQSAALPGSEPVGMIITSLHAIDSRPNCSRRDSPTEPDLEPEVPDFVRWSYDQFDAAGLPLLKENMTRNYLARNLPKRFAVPARQAAGPAAHSPTPATLPRRQWAVPAPADESLAVQAYDAKTLQPVTGTAVRPHVEPLRHHRRGVRGGRSRGRQQRHGHGLKRITEHRACHTSVSFAHYHYPGAAGAEQFDLRQDSRKHRARQLPDVRAAPQFQPSAPQFQPVCKITVTSASPPLQPPGAQPREVDCPE
eukprot:TRINITY_DN8049_c0_g1_i1.p1 TRINITY_DN8049_c0_g1~~TRINITY_DN8049_c0_g1_i1.p1  ORF type:complete len:575 (+),score=147.62 TRINITY_DN8049_c0_g1_i1:68-1726(+)